MGDYRSSDFGICVRDLDRSLRFFCDGLGFEEAEGFELDVATGHLVDCGATVVEGTRASPGIDLLFLADPDGVRLELMALPE